MKSRFITSVLTTAQQAAQMPLPWQRGAARAAMIARRQPAKPAPAPAQRRQA
jgi:hypothetical protein